jgi:hypothetical protein
MCFVVRRYLALVCVIKAENFSRKGVASGFERVRASFTLRNRECAPRSVGLQHSNLQECADRSVQHVEEVRVCCCGESAQTVPLPGLTHVRFQSARWWCWGQRFGRFVAVVGSQKSFVQLVAVLIGPKPSGDVGTFASSYSSSYNGEFGTS